MNDRSTDGIGTLVPLRENAVDSDRPPLCLVHPLSGYCDRYRPAASLLSPGRAVFGIEAHGLARQRWTDSTARIEELANDYVRLLAEKFPSGEYHLAGWSVGGAVVYEMARQLAEQGKRAKGWVALFDTVAPGPFLRAPEKLGNLVPSRTAMLFLRDSFYRAGVQHPPEIDLSRLSPEEIPAAVLAAAREHKLMAPESTLHDVQQRLALLRGCAQALAHYEPGKYDGPITFFGAAHPTPGHPLPKDMGWDTRVQQPIEYHSVEGGHFTLGLPEFAPGLARTMSACLEREDARLR